MLRPHHAVSAPVCLARDHGNFGHRGFSVSVEQLRAVPDDATKFLSCARKKTRHVFESQNWDLKGVTKSDETRALDGRVDIETSSQVTRLIRHNAYALASHPGEPHDDVPGEVLSDFKEMSVVDNAVDDVA